MARSRQGRAVVGAGNRTLEGEDRSARLEGERKAWRKTGERWGEKMAPSLGATDKHGPNHAWRPATSGSHHDAVHTETE
jgi:hypothetical protein